MDKLSFSLYFTSSSITYNKKKDRSQRYFFAPIRIALLNGINLCCFSLGLLPAPFFRNPILWESICFLTTAECSTGDDQMHFRPSSVEHSAVVKNRDRQDKTFSQRKTRGFFFFKIARKSLENKQIRPPGSERKTK